AARENAVHLDGLDRRTDADQRRVVLRGAAWRRELAHRKPETERRKCELQHGQSRALAGAAAWHPRRRLLRWRAAWRVQSIVGSAARASARRGLHLFALGRDDERLLLDDGRHFRAFCNESAAASRARAAPA